MFIFIVWFFLSVIMFQWLLAVEIWEAHKINLCIQENLASAIMRDQISLLPTSSKEEEEVIEVVVTAMTEAATWGTHPYYVVSLFGILRKVESPENNLMTSQSILTAAKFNGLIIPLKSPHKSKFSLRNSLRKEMISITTLTWRALRLQNLQAVDHENRLWRCIGLMNLMPLPAARSQLLLSCQTVLPLDHCKMSLKGFVPHTRLRVWV